VKPERCGSPVVQEKYQEEKACDKRHPYRIIIILILIIIIIIIIKPESVDWSTYDPGYGLPGPLLTC